MLRYLWLAMTMVAVASAGPMRVWTSTEGDRVEAELVRVEGETVILKRRADGKIFEMPMDWLSPADQAFLQQPPPAPPPAPPVSAKGEGIYIAVGNGLHRMSSNDGVVWENHVFVDKPGHNQNDLKSIAVGNDVCVAVGGFSKSNILSTTDGIDWHINKFNIGVLSGVIFLDGRFLVFGEGGAVAESKNGVDWERAGAADFREHLKEEADELGIDKPLKSNIRAWRHSNGVFMGSGDNGVLLTTCDFQKWNYPPRIEPYSRLYLESDENGFVVRGDRTLHFSPDGESWTEVTPKLEEKERLFTITHDGERFLVTSREGRGWFSDDGKTWEEAKGAEFPGTIMALRPDLIYSFASYYQFTEDLRYSDDGGKSWESAKLPAPAGVTNLIFAPGFPKF